MFFSYKNSKVLINGSGILADNAALSLQSNDSPIYQAESKARLNYAPSNGVGGSLRLSYYLTEKDVLRNYIDNDNVSISGYFGGLYFSSGYLKSYSFNGAPNTPVKIESEIVFFDELKGAFNPSYDGVQQTGIFIFTDACIINATTKISEQISNIIGASYNYNADISPSYAAGDTLPQRVVFGPKETNISIDCDQLDGDLSVYGKGAVMELRVRYPSDTGIFENYKVEGILYKRDINSSAGELIKSNLTVKDKTIDNAPVIFYFNATSGVTGAAVSIYGVNLTTTNTVYFNSKAVTGFNIINDGQIDTFVPTGALTGPITVATSNSQVVSQENFTIGGQSMSITNISPITGAYGSVISIVGTNFSNINDVMFTPVKHAAFNVVNDTLIYATVPPYAVWGAIRVDSSTMAAVTSNQLFVPIPVIDGFTPTSGISGDSILFSGRGFSGITGIQFNNLPNSAPFTAPFGVVTTRTITGQVPTGNVYGYVRIFGQSGVTARTDLYFNPILRVTGLLPTSGLTGATISVLGENFIPALMYPVGANYLVSFNNGTGGFTRINSNRLDGTVPSTAKSGPVNVYQPDGSGLYPNSSQFTLMHSPPRITDFHPGSGKYLDAITVLGTDFFDISTGVKLSGTANNSTPTGVTGINIGSNNDSLSFSVPNLSGGLYNILISNQWGNTATGLFRVLEIPFVSGFKPLSGIAGQTIRVSGSNFYSNSKVYIENTGTPVTVIPSSFSDNTFTGLQFIVPNNSPASGRIVVCNDVGCRTGTAYFTKLNPPIISGFIPISGIYGTKIRLSGAFLDSVTGVYLGSNITSFTGVGGTGIHFTVPQNSVTDYINLYILGDYVYSSSSKLTVIPPVVGISGFTPVNNYRGSGLLISGSRFDTAQAIIYSGSNNTSITQTSFTVVGSTGILTTVPSTAVSGRIGITNPGGTAYSNTALNIILPPSITTVTPVSGKYRDIINLSGQGFLAAAFYFQGWQGSLIAPLATTILTDSGATVQVPREIIVSPIYISGYNGLSGVSTDTFVPIPTISGFDPSNLLSGQALRITGINASQMSVVGITGHGSTANLITSSTLVIDNSRITNVGGTGTTGYTLITGLVDTSFFGTGKIYLVPSGYTATDYAAFENNSTFTGQLSNNLFIRKAPPFIYSFSPSRGNVNTLVTLTGSNLLDTQVLFVRSDNAVDSGNATIITNTDNLITFNPPTFNSQTSGFIGVVTYYGATGTSGIASTPLPNSGYFTYINAPLISGFAPLSGRVGDTVRITGNYLQTVTGIFFNDISANFTGATEPIGYVVTGTVPYVTTSNPNLTITAKNEAGQSIKSGFTLITSYDSLYYPLNSNPSGYLNRTLIQNAVTGLGTANYFAKFTTDGSGLITGNIFETGGSVGIGTSTPGATLDVMKTSATAFRVKDANSNARFVVDTTNSRVGINTATPLDTLHIDANGLSFAGGAVVNIAGNISVTNAGYGIAVGPNINVTATNYIGVLSAPTIAAAAITVTNLYGVEIANPVTGDGSKIVNNYGLYIDNQTAGSGKNYAIYSAGGTSYFSGSIGINTASPISKLDVSGDIYASGGKVLTAADSGNLVTIINNTGSQAWSAANSNSINLSGKLESTGTSLQGQVNTLTTNLTTTGATLRNLIYGLTGQLDATGAAINTIRTNLDTTGTTLRNLIYGLTGQLDATGAAINTIKINLDTTGTTLLNRISGLLNSGQFLYKMPVRVATTTNLDPYTVTGNTLSQLVPDGLDGLGTDGVIPIAGDRILVKDESLIGSGQYNGIYTVIDNGGGIGGPNCWVITRSNDADLSSKVKDGLIVYVEQGTINKDKLFCLTTNNTITLNTTSLTFIEVGSVALNATGAILDSRITTERNKPTVTGINVTGSISLTGLVSFVGAYGTNVIHSGNTIAISGGGGGGAGGGEANTASNLGVGVGAFSSKVGVDLQFYSLSGVSGTKVTRNGNQIEIGTPNFKPSTTGSNVVNDIYHFDWTSGDVFYRPITGNNFVVKFTGYNDGQTIVIGLFNTGFGYTGAFPSNVKWPNNTQPIQSSGFVTDIYTFVCINTGIFGNAVQGFPGKP